MKKYKWLIIGIALIAGCSLYIGYLLGINSYRPVGSITNTVTPTAIPTITEVNNKLPEDSLIVKKEPLDMLSKNWNSEKLDSIVLLYENKVYVPLDVIAQLIGEYGLIGYSNKNIAFQTPLWKPFMVEPQLLWYTTTVDEVEKMLGKPISSKKESWEGGSVDILINKYHDAEITFMKVGDVFKVYNFTITTDKIMTDRYIKVGSTVDEVRQAYGPEVPDENGIPDSLVYGMKDMIIFGYKDGKVTSITLRHWYG